jgi:hypothetical protein
MYNLNTKVGTDANKEYWDHFLSLTNQLSPENLYRDGMRTRQEAMAAKEQILKTWKNLEVMIGHKVTEDMVIARFSQRKGA